MIKPYQQVPIQECGEALVPIPLEQFAVETPHPYASIGAPYQDKSPYYLRQGVLERLLAAQALLQHSHPGWRIQIFDAYRPIAVQQFMVDYTFQQILVERRLVADQLSPVELQALWQEVYQFWAVPSDDPAMPPPHSTGAAIDITLVDAAGKVIEMGSPIDEMSVRSYPNYFVDKANATQAEALKFEPISEVDRLTFHHNRQLLQQVMTAAEFCQHPKEWWHFSFGDQGWAWLLNQAMAGGDRVAKYGAI